MPAARATSAYETGLADADLDSRGAAAGATGCARRAIVAHGDPAPIHISSWVATAEMVNNSLTDPSPVDGLPAGLAVEPGCGAVVRGHE